MTITLPHANSSDAGDLPDTGSKSQLSGATLVRTSDYDLMVVVPDHAPPELKDCDLAYRALRGLGIAKDLLVWTHSEFEKRLHLKASLPSTIVREGKLLHAA